MLIPRFGYIVAAYTTVIGYGFSLLFHYIVCRRTIYRDLFEKRIMVINIGLCLGAMLLSLALYQNNIIRILVIILIVLIVIICGIRNRNKIKKYFRK